MRNFITKMVLASACSLGAAAGCSSSDGSSPATSDAACPLSDASAPDAATQSDALSETSPPDGATEADAGIATDAAPMEAAATGLAALPGYTVSVWATGGTAYKGPDSVELDGTHIWVGYQMGVKSKDGSDAGGPLQSQIVEYNLDGTLAGKSFMIDGHCDGVRVNPVTHIVWATSNEDGGPVVVSFDPATSVTTKYTLPATLDHGGGLDDIAFFDGKMIVADSNPNTPNTFPALSVMNVTGTNITFSPFLMGNANAYNPIAGTTGPLSLTDPDSLTMDSSGNLVLVSQADSELVVISKSAAVNDGGVVSVPLDAGPAPVQVIPVGTQVDDTVWATKATGFLLVADASANTIYKVSANFTPGAVFTESPDDSLVTDFLGTVDLTSGAVHPIVIGFTKATGLIFVPQ